MALTRAEQRIVVSSVQPHAQAFTSSWRDRIGPLTQPLPAPEPAAMPAAGNPAAATVNLPDLPACAMVQPVASSALPATAEDDSSARIGLALHRLLQWVPTPLQGFQWDDAHRQAVAREFALTPAQAQQALDAAQAVLGGQAAWAWDAAQLGYWGNEVELWADGQLQRLDRLVRRADTGCWWVLDYKSALRPDQQSALREQLQRYHRALSQAHPG